MKARSFLLRFVVITVFTSAIISSGLATVVTFDELSENGTGSFLANGYQGLAWSNFVVQNAIVYTANNGLKGYYYGMVSASNNAFNAFGNPAEIDSLSTNFNFQSAYLTGAWNSNLNIQVQGFRGGGLIYNQTVVASATNATLFTFNYLNIDSLTFNSFGGQSAGFPGGSGNNFVMDNFTFDLVPEPSSLLLATGGTLLLWPILKRKRA